MTFQLTLVGKMESKNNMAGFQVSYKNWCSGEERLGRVVKSFAWIIF